MTRPRRPAVTTRIRPTHAEVSTLADLSALVDSARHLRDQAKGHAMPQTTREAQHIAKTLDAARTCLVQEGESYLDAAQAIATASQGKLLDLAVRIGGVADAFA